MFLYDHDAIQAINSNFITIGDFEIKKYAMCIMFGALLAFIFGLRWAKRLGIKEDVIYTGFAWGLIVGVLGARTFYCVFDDFNKVITKPWTIITEFRNGGLAISGAIISVAIYAVIYCRIVHINPIYIGELVAPGFLIGQICGRWGNFFNQEAHGGLVPGATLDAQREWLWFLPKFIKDNMYISNLSSAAPVVGYYQPTFLYESVLNLIGLLLILALRKWWKKYRLGDALFIYLMWYGCVRFNIEIMRTDAQTIGNSSIKVVQVLCIFAMLIGLVFFILRHKFHWFDQPWINADPEKVNNSFGKVNRVSETNVDNGSNESNGSNKVIADNVDNASKEANGSSEPGKE